MRAFLLCLVSAGSSLGARAQAPGEAAPRAAGVVSWSALVVRATGVGAPDVRASNPAQARLGAERAALAAAFQNLLGHVKGVSVDGSRTLGELMARDEVRTRVEGAVKSYRVMSKRYFSDHGVEVEVEVPLTSLSDVVDPDATQILAVGRPEEARTITGLVIDARGLKVIPSLLPRVLEETGKPLYSIDALSPDARRGLGVASFVRSMDDAKKSQRAGDRPLVVKAAKADGADLTLDAEGAQKLASLNTGFLADGRVVIVLNEALRP